MLGVGDDVLWWILTHHVDRALEPEDFSEVRAIDIDETVAKRGQDDITLFHDLENKRLLFGCEGLNQSTIREFVHDLKAHGGATEHIHAAFIDMSKAYIAGVMR